MPRVCSICHRADRLAIEGALRGGTPLRTIASRWNVSKTALLRHRDKHVRPTPETPQRPQVPRQPACAPEAVQALAAYQEALQNYEELRQAGDRGQPMLSAGFLSARWYQVKRAYQRCLACGVDPARQAHSRIQKEHRA